MPAMIVPRETTELIETTAVSVGSGQESARLHRASLQNPTEWRRNSPFFGRVLCRFVFDGAAVGRMGGYELKIVVRARAKERISLLWISGECHDFNPV
jgi:hypothetical protein